MKTGTSLAFVMIIMAFAVASCVATSTNTNPKEINHSTLTGPKEINHVSALPGYDIDSLYKAFLECSKDEGDMGCDSCWAIIMDGYVDDSYWHDRANSYVSKNEKRKKLSRN